MSFPPNGHAQRRNNPFARAGPPSPASTGAGRPKSALISSPSPSSGAPSSPLHGRSQSTASPGISIAPPNGALKHYRHGTRNSTPLSNTFAPSFIKTDEMKHNPETVKGIEGENDFSGKRYVWVKDPQSAFVKGWVVQELEGSRVLVQCDDGSVSIRSHGRRSWLMQEAAT